MIILGIDPGTATTGYGLIDYPPEKNQKRSIGKRPLKAVPKCLAYGVIRTEPNLPQPKRLQKIYLGISGLIREWKPKLLAIENIYFFKNLKTAIPVSQAKGVILLAAAQKKVPTLELTPLQVKTAITGYGRSEKRQMQAMVKLLLKLQEIPRPDDAADALGVALCSIYCLGRKNLDTQF